MLLIAQATAIVDLQSVVIHGGVLEETVVRIEHFLRQQIEPLPSKATIIYNIIISLNDIEFSVPVELLT